MVGAIPYPHSGVPDINHLPNSFDTPILTKSTMIGGVGIPDKNKNVFKVDSKTENLVKQLLGLNNKSKFSSNAMALRLDSNIPNQNTIPNTNDTNINNSTDNNKDYEEDDQDHFKKEHAQMFHNGLNSSNNNFNSNNNLLNYPSLPDNNSNSAINTNQNNFVNLNKNSNLPFRTNGDTDNKQNNEHQHQIDEDDDDDENDDFDSFSIKGKSSDFYIMQSESGRIDENLFLQNKENLKRKKLKNKLLSSTKILTLKNKKTNNLRNDNTNMNSEISLNERNKESEDFFFDDKINNLFIEKNSYEEHKNKNNEFVNLFDKKEVSQEDFLKTIYYNDMSIKDSKSNNNKKLNLNKKDKYIIDDEFKLQKELYEMQHNQTLLEEIKKGKYIL